VKFKFDENLPLDLGVLLREAGHDAHSVFEENLRGAADKRIAKACQDEHRILITLDLDFAHIKNYPPRDYSGIIVLRLDRQNRETVLAIARRLLRLLETEPISERLWIVDEKRTRIRGES
jgi:predicted nuclease of predicted toxin-antitoxin system